MHTFTFFFLVALRLAVLLPPASASRLARVPTTQKRSYLHHLQTSNILIEVNFFQQKLLNRYGTPQVIERLRASEAAFEERGFFVDLLAEVAGGKEKISPVFSDLVRENEMLVGHTAQEQAVLEGKSGEEEDSHVSSSGVTTMSRCEAEGYLETFCGDMGVGHPETRLRVEVDTGSADLVVPYGDGALYQSRTRIPADMKPVIKDGVQRVAPLFQNLIDDRALASPTILLDYGATPHLVFGPSLDLIKKLDLSYVPLKSDTFWDIEYRGFTHNEGHQIPISQTSAIIDSSGPFIALPQEDASRVMSSNVGARPTTSSAGSWTIPCDADISLSVHFDGIDVALEAATLRAATLDEGSNLCLANIIASDIEVAVLGLPFLKNVYTLLDASEGGRLVPEDSEIHSNAMPFHDGSKNLFPGWLPHEHYGTMVRQASPDSLVHMATTASTKELMDEARLHLLSQPVVVITGRNQSFPGAVTASQWVGWGRQHYPTTSVRHIILYGVDQKWTERVLDTADPFHLELIAPVGPLHPNVITSSRRASHITHLTLRFPKYDNDLITLATATIRSLANLASLVLYLDRWRGRHSPSAPLRQLIDSFPPHLATLVFNIELHSRDFSSAMDRHGAADALWQYMVERRLPGAMQRFGISANMMNVFFGPNALLGINSVWINDRGGYFHQEVENREFSTFDFISDAGTLQNVLITVLGAFFTHWLVDHGTIWRSEVLESSIQTSLIYYSALLEAPHWYLSILSLLAGVAIFSTGLKVLINGTSGLMFDGASFMLLLSALAVYITNVHASLQFLPLPYHPSTASVGKGSLGEGHVTEALQSIAASHMIIAVSLTGVLALQAAQGYSDKPSHPSLGEGETVPNTPVPGTPAPKSPVPASSPAPSVRGRKSAKN
ncbi:Shr3 amino acid permease chaperone [Pseudohyphozyma bogoriensis]|nr:Shr3 amino acid permease chaperone [Pseudohyphozyma bogoriensis]